jgi:hypothetical protein
MGKMKELYMDIMDYAEECCGSTIHPHEAWEMFSKLYPEEHDIFEEAWQNWDSFSQYIMTVH